MNKLAIFGSGQIGRAVKKIVNDVRLKYYQDEGLAYTSFTLDSVIVIDQAPNLLNDENYHSQDLNKLSSNDISLFLKHHKITHVINALPFFLNEKIATASFKAGCSYIDFTEDDKMADTVQSIYGDSGLKCAVKCGLAPGFVNYIGHNLIKQIRKPESLVISVGALPRSVSFGKNSPENSYNLTWSVDGLVNEYIRPCRVRLNGEEKSVDPLSVVETVLLDGVEYEAAYTSGGIGSLVKELTNVPNVSYMTLRYPGHYDYVKDLLKKSTDFDYLKKEFTDKFYHTNDDVIVVYANALGRDEDNQLIRRSYFQKFYGVNGLTGIQSTTAGSGVAMLEIMLKSQISGIINHADVDFKEFTDTTAFKTYYSKS